MIYCKVWVSLFHVYHRRLNIQSKLHINRMHMESWRLAWLRKSWISNRSRHVASQKLYKLSSGVEEWLRRMSEQIICCMVLQTLFSGSIAKISVTRRVKWQPTSCATKKFEQRIKISCWPLVRLHIAKSTNGIL